MRPVFRAAASRVATRLSRRVWFASAAPSITTWIGESVFRRSGRRVAAAAGPDVAHARRILVVRLDKIGDVVLTTAFLRELARSAPRARITVVVSPGMRVVVDGCSGVDEVLTYDARASRYLGPLRNAHAAAYAARHLWPRRFDVAIVPRWDVDYYHAAALAYLSGAPMRLGVSERVTPIKARLNRGYDRFYTHLSEDAEARHEVEHGFSLLRRVGATVEAEHLEVQPPPEAVTFAADLFRTHDVAADDLVIAFAPGAGAARRQWPADRLATVAAWVAAQPRARVVLLGGSADARLGADLARAVGAGVIDLVGRASLPQTVAVLRRCALFVGNDSGPMHLAAAAGARVVAVSCHPEGGSALHENAPERFAPWGVPYTIVRPAHAAAPCVDGCEMPHPHCIRGVTVDAVRAAVAEHLAQITPQSPLAHPSDARWPDHGRNSPSLTSPTGEGTR